MEILIASILTFVSTNIDDIFLLTLFFGNKKFNEKEIIAGQFLGIITLIAISLAGSLIGLFINKSYIGLLGFIPIYLGIKGLWQLIKKNEHNEDTGDNEKISKQQNNNVLTVAGVTIANGGDNIGIYIPVFATLTWPNKMSMITIFLIMTFIWCLIAKYLTHHPYVSKVVDKYGHIITPFVLILLGLFILHENESTSLITTR